MYFTMIKLFGIAIAKDLFGFVVDIRYPFLDGRLRMIKCIQVYDYRQFAELGADGN